MTNHSNSTLFPKANIDTHYDHSWGLIHEHPVCSHKVENVT